VAPAAPVKPSKPDKPSTPRDHRVRGGETLTAIAQRYECDLKDLAKANGIKAPRYSIRPGQKLSLAGCSN
jgi:membrane-bound lytic murein transglycosylase D